MPNNSSIQKHGFLVGTWLLIAGLLIVFASQLWPMPTGDAIAYMPPMVTFALDGSLTNSAWDLARNYDPTGEGRLVYHGFLYQMVVGTLSVYPTYRASVVTMGILNGVSLALWMFAWASMVFRFEQRLTWCTTFFVAGSALALTTALLGLQGRPEPFVILCTGLAVNLLLVTTLWWHSAILGATLACCATSHPISAVFFGFLCLAYASWRCHGANLLCWLAATTAFGVVTLVTIFSAYPYPITDWIEGLNRHSSGAVFSDWKTDWGHYWLLLPRATFFGVLCLAAFVMAICLIVRRREKVRTRWLFWLAVLGFVASFYYFSVRVSARNYNAQVLTPFATGLLLFGCIEAPASTFFGLRIRDVWSAVASIVFTLSSIGFVRYVTLYPFYLDDGVSYSTARAVAMQLQTERGEGFYDLGFFSVLENYNGSDVADSAFFVQPNDRLDYNWLLLQQTNRSTTTPASVPGYRLIEDAFSKSIPRIFGLKISNTLHGFNYALYVRDDDADE